MIDKYFNKRYSQTSIIEISQKELINRSKLYKDSTY